VLSRTLSTSLYKMQYCLKFQVFSVSSAGVTFAMMADVPALCLGAWRLQSTTALCLPACGWQFLRLPGGRPQLYLIVYVCVIVIPSLPALYSELSTLAQCRNDPPRPADLKRRTLQSCGRLAFSGVCLAMHVGSWIWGIQVRLTGTASKQARLRFQIDPVWLPCMDWKV
jgi:hypothetical protein